MLASLLLFLFHKAAVLSIYRLYEAYFLSSVFVSRGWRFSFVNCVLVFCWRLTFCPPGCGMILYAAVLLGSFVC